ncbi:MAG: MFS transporter, partial [Anaerolineae bacterium]|nr:MFS transporter [Anaerolineae bacterium]
SPLVNLHLFRRRNVNMGLIANLLIGYCIFIGLVSVPILINIRLSSMEEMQDAALLVGILLGAMTVPMALATLPGGWLTQKIGYRRTISLGMVITIIGFVWMWRTWSLDISNIIITIQMILIGTGIGLTFSPISAAVVNSADEDEHGVASSLVLIMRLIGMTVSTTSLTSFALNRVNYLASGQLVGVPLNSDVYLQTYATIAAGVLAELGLIGAIIAGLAILPAWMMKDENQTEVHP